MIKSTEIILPFLGKRNYIQGASILEKLLHEEPPAERFSLKILRPMLSNRIIITPPEKASSPDAIWSRDGEEFALCAHPSSPLREPYDEDALARLIDFSENGASWEADTTEHYIRMAVLALKRLLLRRFPVCGPGQWLFIRWDGAMPLPVKENVQLRLISALKEKAAMARISSEQAPSATLCFAWSDISSPRNDTSGASS